MNNHIKVPTCTCKGCTCGAATKIIQMYEEDKSRQFSMGLNDEEFSQIRSQILAQEPLPNLDWIFNMVMQEENHKKLMTQRERKSETMVVFAVNTSKTTQNFNRPSCKRYGTLGHEETSCFELNGPPSRWITCDSRRGRGQGRGGHAGCGSARGGRGTTTAYMAQVSNEETKQTETDGPQPAIPGLSADQMQKLLSLIEAPKPGFEKLTGNGVWLLDNGASYHKTGDLKKLSKV